MVTTRGVVAQMLTSDMGHKPQLAVEPGDVGLLWKADVYAHTPCQLDHLGGTRTWAAAMGWWAPRRTKGRYL